MDLLKDLDLAYSKDKHASVRCVFQETFRIGQIQRGETSVPVLVPVQALYVIEMDILCVESKFIIDRGVGSTRDSSKARRILETHDFPSAVRRSIVLADQLRDETIALLLSDPSFSRSAESAR